MLFFLITPDLPFLDGFEQWRFEDDTDFWMTWSSAPPSLFSVIYDLEESIIGLLSLIDFAIAEILSNCTLLDLVVVDTPAVW